MIARTKDTFTPRSGRNFRNGVGKKLLRAFDRYLVHTCIGLVLMVLLSICMRGSKDWLEEIKIIATKT